MKYILAITRSLISVATTAHISGLSAAVKLADWRSQKAWDRAMAAEEMRSHTVELAKTIVERAEEEKAAAQAIFDKKALAAGAVFAAAQAEASALRPGYVIA